MGGFLVLGTLLLALGCAPHDVKSTQALLPAPPERALDATQTPPPEKPAVPDPRERLLTEAVLNLLETEHLRHPNIDDALAREAFRAYVGRLDIDKMFLLRSDCDALVVHADRVDDELRSGSLTLAHEGASVFAARVAVVEKLVAELLAAPFNQMDSEFIEIDGAKLEPAETAAELRDRWRRRLELEVLERVAAMTASPEPATASSGGAVSPAPGDGPVAQVPATAEGREAKARGDLGKAYASRFARLRAPAPLGAVADVINAVTSVLDPHTTYLPPADSANLDISTSGSLEGIGAVLREHDHDIEVAEVLPGGASWRNGGLAPGDLILSVAQDDGKDGVEVADMPIDDVVKMIRGKKGTVVKLRIRKLTGDETTIAITRDVLVLEEAHAHGAVLSRQGLAPFGYIYLPSFYGGQGSGGRTASADVRDLLREMKRRRIGGVVLDIRGNGGGLIDEAVDMTGLLVDRGPVVTAQDGEGRREVYVDDVAGSVYDGRVIVLVDRFSASASEILAGALQDYHRAVVVGTATTHGKGTVQARADLDRAAGKAADLGSLKLTIQQFFRVSGASTQLVGVTPDVLLPDPNSYFPATSERSLDHAIPFSRIEPVAHDDWHATWKADTLVAQSGRRVSQSATFAKVAGSTALLRQRRDDTLIPLARDAWEARRKEQKGALEMAEPHLDQGPPRFLVAAVGDKGATVAPRPGGTADDRGARWRDGLAHDPWIEECLFILRDMAR